MNLPDSYLDEVVPIKGLGKNNVLSRLLKREKGVCLYERSDRVWEVFRPRVKIPKVVFGKSYPRREVYPGNEDFGDDAFCYTQKENAERMFDFMTGWTEFLKR